jgi:signal-transduction protein with cAMP-binding, CBS, and nucleotidyltransferase domain
MSQTVGPNTSVGRVCTGKLLSEADLVAAIVERAPMQTTCVRDYMAVAPITVSAKDDAELAARYMLEHEIGHLPVMESSEAVGMLSRSDVLAVGAAPEPYRGGQQDD